MVGWSDVPADLSDRVTLKNLSAALPQDALWVSSDLTRAKATARAVRSGADPDLIDARLREINLGTWELRAFDEIEAEDGARVRAFWDEPGTVRPPGGESWYDLQARVDAGIDDLLVRAAGAPVVVVAHFGSILTQIQRAEQLSALEAFSHHVDNLSLTKLSYDGNWRLHFHNQRL